MRVLRDAVVTAKGYEVSTVSCVHEKGMKDPRCIVASDSTLKGRSVKRLYGKRLSCEETFWNIKDLHFGMGMKWQRIKRPDRRDPRRCSRNSPDGGPLLGSSGRLLGM